MTQVNSAIKPIHLTDEHLLAEHREIKRIPNDLLKRPFATTRLDIPEKFCLSHGHVRFFRDKLKFLYRRYRDIRAECKRRNFKVDDYSEPFKTLEELGIGQGEYTPTFEEHALLRERITERIMESPKEAFHYYGNLISKAEAINLITNTDKYE